MAQEELTGLEKLRASNAVFKFRNRTSVPRSIPLGNGDSVQVGPRATAKIASANIIQLPPFADFLPITPSVDELIAAGLIGETTETNPVPTTPATPEPSPNSTGGQPLTSSRKSGATATPSSGAGVPSAGADAQSVSGQ